VLVWKLLNARREKRAREAAQQAGLPAAEVEEAVLFARLSVHTVRRDIRHLTGLAQEAGIAGAAVFLDDQIAAVRDEIQHTHELDEMIMSDLERSRVSAWTRTRGRRQPGEEGKMEPSEILRHRTEEGAAEAALYGRLQENLRRRENLRAELRLLRFGRQNVPEPEDLEDRTLAQAVMELEDPEKARDAALRLLRRELRQLSDASRVPLSGDMLALERLRVQQLEVRIRNLRDYIRMPGSEGEDGATSFEVLYEEIPVRRLAAGNPTEEEGGESGAT
jgi:hypothetical protein